MVIGSHICSEISMKTKKKSGKTVRKSGKSQGISWDKKSGNPVITQIIDKTIAHKTMTQTQNHCVGILTLLTVWTATWAHDKLLWRLVLVQMLVAGRLYLRTMKQHSKHHAVVAATAWIWVHPFLLVDRKIFRITTCVQQCQGIWHCVFRTASDW